MRHITITTTEKHTKDNNKWRDKIKINNLEFHSVVVQTQKKMFENEMKFKMRSSHDAQNIKDHNFSYHPQGKNSMSQNQL